MIKKILNLAAGEAGMYLIFGVLTTIVNYGVFYIFLKLLGDDMVLTVNTIAFVFAVTFAYITNKIFVFKSKSWKLKDLGKEIAAFLTARIVSYFFEQIGLLVCVEYWNVGEISVFGIDGVLISKVVLSFIAVLVNYIFSKFIIFKKK